MSAAGPLAGLFVDPGTAARAVPAEVLARIRGGVTVVAGNGPSLAAIAPGRVLARDAILRTNSFFLEPRHYLGTRVDLAVLSGDPRVLPFVAETLRDQMRVYDLKAVVPKGDKAKAAAQRRISAPQVPLALADAATADELARLCAAYRAEPTAGVLTLLLAHALGARDILIAGIDLYAGGGARYAFDPGPNMRRLMGQDFGRRGVDADQHHPDLDRRMIAWLAARPGMRIARAADPSPLSDLLPLAPARDGAPPDAPAKAPVSDWAGMAGGWYPAWALVALRRGRALQRRVWDRIGPGRPDR
jgi:hypothetical protein